MESPNSASLRVAHGLIEATDRLNVLSDQGSVYMLLIEEGLLTEAVHDGTLLSAVNGPDKLLEALLVDTLKIRLYRSGDFPRFFYVNMMMIVACHMYLISLRTCSEIVTCELCSADILPPLLEMDICAIESDDYCE